MRKWGCEWDANAAPDAEQQLLLHGIQNCTCAQAWPCMPWPVPMLQHAGCWNFLFSPACICVLSKEECVPMLAAGLPGMRIAVHTPTHTHPHNACRSLHGHPSLLCRQAVTVTIEGNYHMADGAHASQSCMRTGIATQVAASVCTSSLAAKYKSPLPGLGIHNTTAVEITATCTPPHCSSSPARTLRSTDPAH